MSPVPPAPLRRVGPRAALIDSGAPAALRTAILAWQQERADTQIEDVVPGAGTVLVRWRGGDPPELDRALDWRPAGPSAAGTDPRVVTIPVVYDGPDLDEVAALTGLSRREVVAAHTGASLTVAFSGFAPGFGYLTGLPDRLRVPRRADPRTRIPPGSVGLAGEFTGVYPRASPGGWQLIGRTGVTLWDVGAEPPALLAPGDQVRFVEASADDAEQPAEPPAAPAEVPSPALTVRRAGPLTTVQDTGRIGWAHLGVPRSGAADPAALARANALVGNPGTGSAGLEVTLGGLEVVASTDVVMAVTGARCPISVDGRPQPHAVAFAVPAGAALRLDTATAGLRAYLAVAGGFAVPPVLGSRSTDTLSGLGPARIVDGTRLPVGRVAWPNSLAGYPGDVAELDLVGVLAGMAARRAIEPVFPAERVLRVRPGPRADWFAPDAIDVLCDAAWTVGADTDRVGARLEGPELRRVRTDELPSEGMVAGALQIPPGGGPVLFLADHPVTGGYPVLAVVEPADLWLAAQAPPGTTLRLRSELTGG